MKIQTRKIAQDSDSLFLSAYVVIVDGEEIGEVQSWQESYVRRGRHYKRLVWFVNENHAYGYDTRAEAIREVIAGVRDAGSLACSPTELGARLGSRLSTHRKKTCHV